MNRLLFWGEGKRHVALALKGFVVVPVVVNPVVVCVLMKLEEQRYN